MAVVGAGLLTALSVPASYFATKQRVNGPDLWVGTQSTPAPSLYAAVGQLPQIGALTPIYPVQVGVVRAGTRELPAAISPLPDAPPAVGHLTLAGGGWPAPDAEAALVERGAAESMGVGPGSIPCRRRRSFTSAPPPGEPWAATRPPARHSSAPGFTT